MSVFGFLGDLLAHAAQALDPLFGTASTAAAIVLFTLCVRAALHPLARAAARGEKARTALAPQIAALQRTHGRDPERLRKAMADLYATTGASPLAGCLPTLLQLPVFFVMYHLFSTGSGTLLDHTLLGAPLGGRWSQALDEGGVFGPQGLVYLALFALIAAVATWNFRRARAAVAAAPQAPAGGSGGSGAVPGMAGMAKVMPLLSFGMLITVAVVPLAAGLYTVTTTTWTACERALLHRDRTPRKRGARASQSSGPAPAAGAETAGREGSADREGAAAHVPEAARREERQVSAKQRAARSRAERQRAVRQKARSRAATGSAGAVPGTSPGPGSGPADGVATTTR